MTNELYHHGVKGQSWGKRNGPPYPLYRKSAYYKKTGKRPPGYTGDKKGKSDSGGPNKSGKIGGLSDLKRAGGVRGAINTAKNAGKKGRIGGLPNENAKGNTDTQSEAERKAKLKKRILIGAGIAAGVAGGALIGRKLYQAKAAQGAAGVESAAKELRSSFLKNKAAQTESSAIKETLDKAYQNSAKAAASERAGIVNKKLSLQNEALGLKDKKGIRALLARRKNSKALNEIEQKLAANSTKSANAKLAYERNLANNAFAANNANANYEKAKKIFERSKGRENALKRIGNRQAIASTLGFGAAGGAAGYGISKIANRRKQKARIQNRRIGGIDRLTINKNDSAVTRRVKSDYNRMTDEQFKTKYRVSKNVYGKRAEKYGDPYKNAPLAKLGRILSRKRGRR